MTFRFRLWGGLFILAMAAGCVRTLPAPAPSSGAPTLRTLTVLPVTAPDPAGPAAGRGQLREGARRFDSLLADYFRDHSKRVRVISQEQQEILTTGFAGSRPEAMRLIGRRLESDAVLEITLERFHERQGTSYGVIQPASVAFRSRLIHVESGTDLCPGMFTETQQPLSADLFSWPKAAARSFKWVQAEDLAREGLHRELDRCPELQQLLLEGQP